MIEVIMDVNGLNTVIRNVSNGINDLIQDSLALNAINIRHKDAHDYCIKYQIPGAWGKNLWHAILDDAIRLREENLKMQEELAGKKK